MSLYHLIKFKLRASPEEYLSYVHKANAADDRARAIESLANQQADVLKQTVEILRKTLDKLATYERKEKQSMNQAAKEGAPAPGFNPNLRVTLDMVEGAIKSEDVYRVPGTAKTIVTLILTNGFTVVGESACADPAMFNEELGVKYAREDAIEKVYELEAYRLMSEFNRDKV